MTASSQQLSFRTSRLRRLAAGVAATTVAVGGLVALAPNGKRPASMPPAPAFAGLVNRWSTRTGGVLAGRELSAVAAGAFVDGWSTRTGGVLASQQLRCADPHGAYVDGWSTRTGGVASC